MIRTLLPTALLSLVAASAANAAEILVPGDTPSLQQAIDMASPGDIIRVQWANSNGIITVDKPLTILGEPVCNLDVGCFNAPAIRLLGPGSGKVVLHGIRAEANADCSKAPTQIVGGGFSALHMYDCVVRTPSAVGLGPVPLPHFSLPAGAPLNLTVNISSNPALAALEFGLQFLKRDGTLSRPIWGVHVP